MSKLEYSVEFKRWINATSSFDEEWTDITADVIMPGLECSSGTTGTTIKDRVSDVGICTFDLDNSASNSHRLARYYSPGYSIGFEIGCPVRVRFTFEGLTRTKWYGRIGGINAEPGTMLTRRSHVTCYDWFYQANKYTLQLPSYEVNKRINDAMGMVIADIPFKPLSTEFAVGDSAFPTIFDNVNYRTTAMAEFQKLAVSEIGNIYLKHDLSGEEILTNSNKYRRALTALSEYTLPDSTASALLDEDGSIILDEDGSYLLSDDTADIVFADEQMELAYSYGDKLCNHAEVTTYPRNPNTTVGVLFTMTDPVMIAAGETVEFYKVIYKDPSSRAYAVCGKNIVPVVASTDYLFNTASDGSGTNITSDLAITGIYGVSDTEFSFTNNNASDGYITFLQIRGEAIYLLDKVTRIAEDQNSINRYGLFELTYDMPYQPPPFTAQTIADFIVLNYTDPLLNANSISFSNSSDDAVQKFLSIDCNARISVSETQTLIDSHFFIQGWNFQVLGNNDTTGLIVKETVYLYQVEHNSYVLE